MGRNVVVTFACLILALRGVSLEDEFSSEFLQTRRELNEKCSSTKDCRPFGYVCKDNRTCQCDHMYLPDVNNKKCVGGVDQRCTYDEHCIDGAFCMNQAICRCKEMTPVALDDGLACGDSASKHSGHLYKMFVIIKVAIFF